MGGGAERDGQRKSGKGGETVPEAVENEASICFFSSTSSLFRAAMYLE